MASGMVKHIPPDKTDPWWKIELPAFVGSLVIFFVILWFSC